MRPPSVFTRRVFVLSTFLLLILSTTGAAPAIQLPRTGRVEGHVRARSGTPLAHAQVFVVGSAVSALTDSAGRYALPMVAEGSVTLRATFVGYQPTQATLTVRPGRTVTQDFTLGPILPRVAEQSVTNGAVSAGLGRASQAYPSADSKVEGLRKGYSRHEIDEPWRIQREPGNTEAYARKIGRSHV